LKWAFIVWFCWKSVHSCKNTCWVQFTKNRAPAAIFQVARRGHVQNR
jgi:hypothetical protein